MDQNGQITIAIGVLFVMSTLCLLLFHRSKAFQRSREPPMVDGAWPLLGHLPLLSGSKATHHLFGSISDNYGPLFTIKIGHTKILVINNSETAKECYTTNDLAVSYRPNLVAIQNMTYNHSMFGHVRVSEVHTSIKELYDVWMRKKGNSDFLQVELKKWFHELAFNTALRIVAGKRYFGETAVVKEDEAQRCLKALREYMRLIGVFTVVSGYKLQEHRHNRATSINDHVDKDFMDVMLSMIDGATIQGFDADTVIKATTMPLCGTQCKRCHFCTWNPTMSCMVHWTPNAKPSFPLIPPVAVTMSDHQSGIRKFREDCILGGYHVSKGTRLLTNLWKIQTDPSIWEDPLEFKPERWFLTAHKEVDVKGNHFEYIPFGSGRRIYPGISFEIRTAHLTLASFLQCFQLSKTSNEPIDMTSVVEITNIKVTPLEVLIKPHLSSLLYESM
ncbi:hypothetical protein PIB30_021493 [Stylosanthes scabra]|uniref:Cytochrome P450 n=1 Tax=Stylosanthes scabra TaxID=79078 RepID=A0ABU6Z7F4_9FABA|nr:hypothetical protein [Stylosanthes scabra]